MKKGVFIKRKAGAFAFLMVVLMFTSCIFTVVLDSITAASSINNLASNTKGYTLRDADPNDYDYQDKLNPDAILATNSIGSDEIVMVMIEVDDNSLGNNYLTYANEKYGSLNEYVTSDVAQGYALNMKARQQSLYNDLKAQFDIEMKYSYTTFSNAFSAYVRYGDIKAIEKVDRVHNVIISERYEAPETFSSSASPSNGGVAENIVKVFDTGIYDTTDSANTGLGTIVAILDTGLDYEHSAFTNFADIDGNGKYYEADIAQKLAANPFTAESTTVGLTAKDVYINEKVPFAYDYADRDAEVFPVANHGTHVAGIVAGHDETIKGAAVGAQLAIMKTFSNESQGGQTADILAAVEDCVYLDVDVINMSLGTNAGFARDKDNLVTNRIYDMVYEAGINLVVSAGNAYSSGFQSTHGLNLTSNPDSAMVGSPSTYEAAMSIGSISGVKTPYMLAYDGNIDTKGNPVNGASIYYHNALDNNGDELKFMDGLLAANEDRKEYEYVVVPGTGISSDYSGLNVRGKIAVVKRGIDTFVNKIEVAQALGAAGVIIRNNVSGVIRMSLGSRKLIPACSINMEIGDELSERYRANISAAKTSKIILDRTFLAGPFMSDFSSWGPSPDLEIKPEIIAHGGDILSAVPGGGYDRLSGTSMAAPNFAGITSLLRQHVIEHAADYGISSTDTNAIRTLVNQLFMSTATIALNEFKDPYSPRKQGSGLADLKKSEDTRAYIYVKNDDGSMYDKSKLSLGDDKERNGVYELDFYVRNISSNKALTYSLNTIVMTEGLSSDGKTVTEIPVLLNDVNTSVKVSEGGSYNRSKKTLTVNKGSDARVSITVKLSKNNKKYLDETFVNGMFVEGFVELKPTASGAGLVDLSIPYLAFYGDWSDAPILDKTIYETSPDDVNPNLQDHEKNKPDVASLVPVGQASRDSEETQYLFHIGRQVYLNADQFSEPAVEMDRSALSLDAHGMYMLFGITGLLRNTKTINIKIKNAYTGQVMLEKPYQNGRKSSGTGGGYIDFDEEIDIRKLASAEGVKFVEGGKYTFEMEAFLDWGDGETYGNRNKFEFYFYVDSVAPEIVDVGIRQERDRNFENPRRFIDIDVYDAQYVSSLDLQYYNPTTKQYKSIFPKGLMPIISQRGGTSRATLEITDIWDFIKDNQYEIMVMICDYAWNTSYQYVNLEHLYNEITELEFDSKYTQSTPLEIATFEEYNLRRVLTVTAADETYNAWDEDFIWTVENNQSFVSVSDEGHIIGLEPTSDPVAVTVTSSKTGASDTLYVKVAERRFNNASKVHPSRLELNYNYADLVTGSVLELKAELFPHVITDDYQLVWSSDSSKNPLTDYDAAGIGWVDVRKTGDLTAKVEVGGVWKEDISGITAPTITVRLQTKAKGAADSEFTNSNVVATCLLSITKTYDVSYNILNKYNGSEKTVVIPDNLGIKDIGSNAFLQNQHIEELVVTEGIENIESAAFAYCSQLRTVRLPATLVTIGEWAFGAREAHNSEGPSITSLETVIIDTFTEGPEAGTRRLRTIGSRAFFKCEKLTTIDLSSVVSIGSLAFSSAIRLETADLSSAKNIGKMAFYACSSLKNVTFSPNASIGEAAFYENYSLESIELPVSKIGYAAFYTCTKIETQGNQQYAVGGLSSIRFTGDAPVSISDFAFFNCARLETLDFGDAVVPYIGMYAFAGASITSLDLPEGVDFIGESAFMYCEKLKTVTIPASAQFTELTGDSLFLNCVALTSIVVDPGHPYLISAGNIIFNIDTGAIVLAAPNGNYSGLDFSKFISDGVGSSENILKRIGAYAFANTNISTLNLTGVAEIGEGAFSNCKSLTTITGLGNVNERISIGSYAFAGAPNLEYVTFANGAEVEYMGEGVFRGATSLTSITLPMGVTSIPDYTFFNAQKLTRVAFADTVTSIGAYAFANSGITQIDTSNVIIIKDAAFMLSTSLVSLNLDNVVVVGDYAFQGCEKLNITELRSALSIGNNAFAWCPSITTISLPEAMIIGDYAFSGEFFNPIYDETANSLNPLQPIVAIPSESDASKANLSSVTNLDNLEYLGKGAFMQTNITTINLPQYLQRIDPYAFAYCSYLTEINVAEANSRYTSVDGVLYGYVPKQSVQFASNGTMSSYSDNSLQLVAYPAARTAEEVKETQNGVETTYRFYQVLKDTVRIEAGAFIGSTLEWIDLPYELTTIGHEAFYTATDIKRIDFHSYEAPSLETVVTSEFLPIWAPSGVYDYKAINVVTAYFRNFAYAVEDFKSKDNPDGIEQTIAITYPSNGIGYNTHIYTRFFASAEATNESVMTTATQAFIDAIWALPELSKMDWNRDQETVINLDKTYNIMSTDQKAFVSQETLSKLQAAVQWVANNEPTEEKEGCGGCGCGTISLSDMGTGTMILGGGLLMLIAAALFLAFRKKSRA